MKDVIHVDVDSSLLQNWEADYRKTRAAIFASLGYTVNRINIRPSGEALPWKQPNEKGKGYHVWIEISWESNEKLSDLERLKLQFLAGDDPGRIWVNFLRITKRGYPLWDKIFGYIVSRSSLPEPCLSCRLRLHLEELRQETVNGEQEKCLT